MAKTSKVALRPETPRKTTPTAAPKSAGRSVWDQIPSLYRHLISVTLLLLIGLVYFSDTTFGNKSLVGSDTVHARAMAKSVLDQEQTTGSPSLWAPNGFSGMPAFSIYYPMAVPQLDAVVRGLGKVLSFPVVPFWVMVLGMYVLGFYLTKDHVIGLFAGVAFPMANFLFLLLIAGHNTKYVTMAWTPWLILAFVYVLRNPKILSGLLFAAALALNLRANHIQMTYYLSFILAFWWLAEGLGAARKNELKSFGWATALLGAGAVLALLMVAQPYWPVQEYKAFTIRGQAEGGASGALDWKYAMAWSHVPGELWSLLFSRAYGGGSQEAYWGAKIFTGGPHYIGGIVILLAILGLVRAQNWAVWAVGFATLLTMLFALGENAAWINQPMFEHFPLFNAFRVPETWLVLSVLGLVLLAIFGLQIAFRQDAATEAGDRKSVLFTVGGVTGLVLLLFLFKGAFFTFDKPDEVNDIAKQIVQAARQQGQEMDLATARQEAPQYVDQLRQERMSAFTADAQRTLIFVLLAGALLLLARYGKIPAFAGKWGLVLLVLIDLWGVSTRYYKTEVLHDKTNVDELAAAQKLPVDDFIEEQVRQAGGAGHFRTLPLAMDAINDGRSPYFYEVLGGYSGAKLRVYQDYLDHILQNPDGTINENGVDLMATRFIIARNLFPNSKLAYVAPDSSMIVVEREKPMPRAWFVSETKTVQDAKQAWEQLRAPQFNLRQTAITAKDPGLKPAVTDTTGQLANVRLKSWKPDEIVWEAKTDVPRLMVASEVWYPAGWAATVDGKPAEIFQTDYVVRGVVVPAGQHEVKMTFAPARDAMSRLLAELATLLCYGGIVALLGWAFFQKRKTPAEQTTETA